MSTSSRVVSCLTGAWALASLLSVSGAGANPMPLPFSYPYQTLPAEKFEVEQFVDMVPVRVAREKPDGTQEGVYSLRSVCRRSWNSASRTAWSLVGTFSSNRARRRPRPSCASRA
jgi:hypothetical protein